MSTGRSERRRDVCAAGLFLMPFGFLNEHHEPTNFYGVQRNFVETLIIPSTWREGGFNLHGDTAVGFGWNVGLTTRLRPVEVEFRARVPAVHDRARRSRTATRPRCRQPIRSSRSPMRSYLSQYLALSYYGVPGLTLARRHQHRARRCRWLRRPTLPIPGTPRVTLWEGHARWTPARWDLSATLRTRRDQQYRACATRPNPGSPNPIPSAFYGYYVQGAYELWHHGEYRLDPFARWEHYNMGSSYQGTTRARDTHGAGAAVCRARAITACGRINHDRVWTRRARTSTSARTWCSRATTSGSRRTSNFKRFDLGLGLAF